MKLSSVTNAASYVAQGGSPSSIGTLWGTNLASGTAAAQALPLPTSLAGTSVKVNGIAAPLYYVSPTQINFQWPAELAGSAQGAVTVTVNGANSAVQDVAMQATTPGLFAVGQSGSGQGAVLIANSATLAAPAGTTSNACPVRRSEYISIFGTGLGAVSNPPADGAPASTTQLSWTQATPTVTIGGVPATVTFSGLAPGYVGLYQVNVQVPNNAPTGSVSVGVQISGQSSNAVTIAVQ